MRLFNGLVPLEEMENLRLFCRRFFPWNEPEQRNSTIRRLLNYLNVLICFAVYESK